MTSELQNLSVVSFESRRSKEMAKLIEKRGGTSIQAPSMQEIPLGDQHAAIEFGELLLKGEIDSIILLTGVGARMFIDAMSLAHPRSEIITALEKCDLLCRGPKPVALLKELDLLPFLTAPEPNTWRELLEEITSTDYPIRHKRVALWEYGRSNPELLDALEDQALAVHKIPIYAWSLPDDTTELQSAIRQISRGEVDIALFTSGQQIDNAMEVANQINCLEPFKQQLATRVLVASIGPITTEALERAGVSADVHPTRPKMGHMISTLAACGRSLLKAKREGNPQPTK